MKDFIALIIFGTLTGLIILVVFSKLYVLIKEKKREKKNRKAESKTGENTYEGTLDITSHTVEWKRVHARAVFAYNSENERPDPQMIRSRLVARIAERIVDEAEVVAIKDMESKSIIYEINMLIANDEHEAEKNASNILRRWIYEDNIL